MVAHVQQSPIAETASAVVDVVHAAERAVEARVDLARAQAARLAKSGALGAAFGVVVVLGWIALMIAVVLFLRPVVDPAISLAVIGGVHFIGGLVGAAVALRKNKG